MHLKGQGKMQVSSGRRAARKGEKRDLYKQNGQSCSFPFGRVRNSAEPSQVAAIRPPRGCREIPEMMSHGENPGMRRDQDRPHEISIVLWSCASIALIDK